MKSLICVQKTHLKVCSFIFSAFLHFYILTRKFENLNSGGQLKIILRIAWIKLYTNFRHNRKMLKYFELYAEHFNLNQYIHLRHAVTNVERSQNFDKDGSWLVHYVDQ